MSINRALCSTAKVWSSCIRDPGEIDSFCCAETNPKPAEGDLVAFRVLSDTGFYQSVEDRYGRDVRIYSGDVCVGVFGTRKSGTNPNGVVPSRPLRVGDTLHLISAAGIVGEAIGHPGYGEARLMQVRVEAFLTDRNGRQASTRSRDLVRYLPVEHEATLIVVGGTSAEVGKTTFICRMIRALYARSDNVRIGSIKAVGTGRLRDILSYRDAGAATVVDFVSMGWPTTYNIPISEYRALLKDMLVLACSGNGIVFIEIGGDLLTKAAAVVLEEASRRRASGILCVNDAMGAITGIRLFTEAGIPLRALSTYRQNHEAMADRLGGHPVVNALDPEAMNGIAAVLDEVRVGRANSLPT